MRLQNFESGEFSWTAGAYTISTERHRLDVNRLLSHFRAEAYWAAELEYKRFSAAIESSLPIAAYTAEGEIAGFCRVVTDGAMFAYLRDVLVISAHRGRGLGKLLTEHALNHPDLGYVDNWLLRTADAHGVYGRFGFEPLSEPESYMSRRTPRKPWS